MALIKCTPRTTEAKGEGLQLCTTNWDLALQHANMPMHFFSICKVQHPCVASSRYHGSSYPVPCFQDWNLGCGCKTDVGPSNWKQKFRSCKMSQGWLWWIGSSTYAPEKKLERIGKHKRSFWDGLMAALIYGCHFFSVERSWSLHLFQALVAPSTSTSVSSFLSWNTKFFFSVLLRHC